MKPLQNIKEVTYCFYEKLFVFSVIFSIKSIIFYNLFTLFLLFITKTIYEIESIPV